MENPPSTGDRVSPTEADITAAAWFAMFGEPHRVAVLRVLAIGEKTAKQLATAAGGAAPNCAGHVAKLKRAGQGTSRLRHRRASTPSQA